MHRKAFVALLGATAITLALGACSDTAEKPGTDKKPYVALISKGFRHQFWQAVKAGAANVEFLKGQIEDIPLPDASIDVVISNCVINLSTDKSAVIAELFRVLTPGGRLGISDVVAEDNLSPAERAKRGSYVGCIAGALSRIEYLDGLTAAGFIEPDVVFTHEAAPGMHGAIIRAQHDIGTRLLHRDVAVPNAIDEIPGIGGHDGHGCERTGPITKIDEPPA